MNQPSPLYCVAEIREIERMASNGLPAATLMRRAGQAAAYAVQRILNEGGHDGAHEGVILVLAGPGNNGGDALDAAALLAQDGHVVAIALHGTPERLPPDAAQAFARAAAGPSQWIGPDPAAIGSGRWKMVIDGLFGIGLARPIEGTLREVVQALNWMACPVLSLDVPSGLDADTGNVVGPDGVAVRATHTLTFLGDKPGLHTAAGRDHAGIVEVAALEVDAARWNQPRAWLSGIGSFSAALRRRAHDSHKGSFGDLAVLGGAAGMGGAPVLAGRAAAYCGAGRVFLGFLEKAPAYDIPHPELMCRAGLELDCSRMTVVAGPGLGTSRAAHDLLAQGLETQRACVLDADALNLLAEEPGLRQKLEHRRAATIITPHPLEAARLLAVSTADIQADRLAAARNLAQRFNAIAVLKGSGTVVARPDGTANINPTGNAGLATAGSGDVLAGICGALLGQGWPAWEAALGAVWMHGAAADALVAQGIGPIGLTAGELAPAARTILNQLTAAHGTSVFTR